VESVPIDQVAVDKRQRQRRAWTRLVGLAALVAVLVTLVVVQPAMPDRLVLYTGPEGSAYDDLGRRYAQELRARGLEVDVVGTDGAHDNLRRLSGSEDAVGFAPTAMDWEGEAGIDLANLVALGSVGFEPIWLFCRSDLEITRVPDLAGRKILSPGPGTAVHHAAQSILELNGLLGTVDLIDLGEPGPQAILERLDRGDADAVFARGAASSPLIRTLLDADGLTLLSFRRAEAYAERIPGVMTLRAPEGVFDLARNVPEEDAQLLATTTCLVAHEGLHSAVVPMILAAARDVHEDVSELSASLEFPSAERVGFPMHHAARRYFRQGEVGLSRFLPYKVTRFLDHLGFFVLPLLTVAFVLIKVVPAVARIRAGIGMQRLLQDLAVVEKRAAGGEDPAQLLPELERVDRASATLFVPRSVTKDYLDLRQALHDLRERVSE